MIETLPSRYDAVAGIGSHRPGPSFFSKSYLLYALLAVLSVFFFVGGPDSLSSRSFKHAWDTGHIIYFFLFTFLATTNVLRLSRMSVLRQWGAILAVSFLFGVFIELLQTGVNRIPEIGDVERDVLGCAAALAFVAPSRFRLPGRLLAALKILVVLLVAASFIPLGRAFYDERLSVRQFPVLAGFESPTEIDRWHSGGELSVSGDVAVEGSHSLKAVLTPDHYGFGLRDFPQNWRGYSTLQLHLYGTADHPVPFVCRIHDAEHAGRQQYYEDRFNRTFLVSPGWNDIRIPLSDVESAPRNRRMDMRRIVAVGLFVPGLSETVTVYLDGMKLTRDR